MSDPFGDETDQWVELIHDRWLLDRIRIEAEPSEAMIDLIAECAIDVNAPGGDGYTALAQSITGGASPRVRKRLELGADP